MENPTNEECIPFLELVIPDDRQKAYEVFTRSRDAAEPVDIELRVQSKTLRNTHHSQDDVWVLFMLYPEQDDVGNAKNVLCCATDITQLKVVERNQIQSRKQAEEARNQQERFIDTTS